MISNIKKSTICRSLSWSKFKRIDTCFVIVVSLIAIILKAFLVELSRC